MVKGKLIVIEGLDGSGKKTQLDLLVKYCRTKKIKLKIFDFPQYYQSFFGKLCGRYLKGEFGSVKEVNPYLSSVIFAADRWQAKPAMIKALKEDKLVIANRYTSSGLAYMAGKLDDTQDKQKIISWIETMEQKIFGCPKEDLVIYLSVPVDTSQKLVMKKGERSYLGKAGHDIHETNKHYLKKVALIYENLCRKYPHWLAVDCLAKGKLKTPTTIHQEIVKLLQKRGIIF